MAHVEKERTIKTEELKNKDAGILKGKERTEMNINAT